MPEPDLRLAERQVRDCEAHAEEQRRLIAYLDKGGYKDAADVVRRSLAATERTLAQKRRQLAKLRGDLGQPGQNNDQDNQSEADGGRDHP